MDKHLFKTAEFAALCGVKKDTLLHYDHIGLLKPQRVGENGYRYYSARQLAAYDLISALRRLDTPLSEIRDYLTRRSPEALLDLLEEKEAALEAERKRLERMGSLLREVMGESFSDLLQRLRCEEAARLLAEQGIGVRAGLHCAPLAHESAGTLETGTVRVSFGHDAAPWQTGMLVQEIEKMSRQS